MERHLFIWIFSCENKHVQIFQEKQSQLCNKGFEFFLLQNVQVYKFLFCGIINTHLHWVCNCFVSVKFSGEHSVLKSSLNHYFLKMGVPHDITISCWSGGG